MRPRRVAQAARAAAAARLAHPASAPTTPPTGSVLLAARLAAIALIVGLCAALTHPYAGDTPLLRAWILQALEHANGGDPRLIVAANTPYGAVLPNPFTDTGWALLATAWTWSGVYAFPVLAATAVAVAVWGWGWAARSALAGAAAALLALLTLHTGAHAPAAVALALVGLGALLAQRHTPVAVLAAGPLWAIAAALDPIWAWAIPPLAAALSHARPLDTRISLAASLLASSALLGGSPWLIQAWMVAAVLPLLHGLPIPVRARFLIVAGVTVVGTGAAGMAGWAHVQRPDAGTTSLVWALALLAGGAVVTFGIQRWRKGGSGTTAPPTALAAAGLAAGIVLVVQGPMGDTRVPMPHTGDTHGACTATPDDVDDLLDWMDTTGVRRLAAPADLAWRVLVRDAERVALGTHTGVSVVDAGIEQPMMGHLGAGHTPNGGERRDEGLDGTARDDNGRILEAARAGLLDLQAGIGQGDAGEKSGTPDASDARVEDAYGARGDGEQAAWKRSVGAIAVCGDMGTDTDTDTDTGWTTLGRIAVAVVER